ncbi:MAG: hypothetical protein LBD21_00585 [Tannerellaceae bacterium]|jgi:hypothetical protein|nr:hypothetical protein [Tannerellaceae bacterium]
MIVEQINDEILIRVSSDIDREDIQRIIDLFNLKEATAKSIATQEDIDNLAEEVQRGWWAANRSRFLSE